MDTVRKVYSYKENGIEKQMYIEAKMTMKTLLITKDSLLEEDPNVKIVDIFDKVENLDAKTISLLILNSLQVCEDKYKLISILEFSDAMELLESIIKKSMPNMDKQEEEEALFEDEDEEVKDWDFSFMDYIWNCVLKRSDSFYDITPSYYFKTIEHHKAFNNIKDNTEKVEYI